MSRFTRGMITVIVIVAVVPAVLCWNEGDGEGVKFFVSWGLWGVIVIGVVGIFEALCKYGKDQS